MTTGRSGKNGNKKVTSRQYRFKITTTENNLERRVEGGQKCVQMFDENPAVATMRRMKLQQRWATYAVVKTKTTNSTGR